MKIGLYFGTFDPIHFGHINIGKLLVKKGILNKVWFVVTPQNPDKSYNNIVDFVHRYEMAKIQLKRNNNLLASDIELNLEKPNYTINTLNYISKKFPNYRFSIIMGEDNFMNFTYWKNYKEILNNYDIYVYPRGGNRKENTELIHSKNVHKIEGPYLNISSSEIRKLINNKENLSGFISEEIYNYIIKNKLYIS